MHLAYCLRSKNWQWYLDFQKLIHNYKQFHYSEERYLCKLDKIKPLHVLIWMVERYGSTLEENSKKISARD